MSQSAASSASKSSVLRVELSRVARRAAARELDQQAAETARHRCRARAARAGRPLRRWRCGAGRCTTSCRTRTLRFARCVPCAGTAPDGTRRRSAPTRTKQVRVRRGRRSSWAGRPTPNARSWPATERGHAQPRVRCRHWSEPRKPFVKLVERRSSPRSGAGPRGRERNRVGAFAIEDALKAGGNAIERDRPVDARETAVELPQHGMQRQPIPSVSPSADPLEQMRPKLAGWCGSPAMVAPP